MGFWEESEADKERKHRERMKRLEIQKEHAKYEHEKAKHGYCFIATAAYGTPMAEEVNVLKKWRDEYLVKTLHGRLFVRAYYNISPPIAFTISKSEIIKMLTRKLLQPIVTLFNK